MNTIHPDPPGAGKIILIAEKSGRIKVKYSDMKLYTLADLFYKAIKTIPHAEVAMHMAMDRNQKDNTDQ